MKVKTYDSPAAFKRALEDRLTGTGSPKAASLVYIPGRWSFGSANNNK